MRAVLFMLLVLVIFALLMMAGRRLRSMTERLDEHSAAGSDSEPTVRCVRCGAYVPRRHAVETKDGPVCPEHQS